eukprot:1300113-Amphidinium_carterae.5
MADEDPVVPVDVEVVVLGVSDELEVGLVLELNKEGVDKEQTADWHAAVPEAVAAQSDVVDVDERKVVVVRVRDVCEADLVHEL